MCSMRIYEVHLILALLLFVNQSSACKKHKRGTHVANAYNQDIFVRVEVDKQLVTSRKGSTNVGDGPVSVGASAEETYKYSEVPPGFARIQKGKSLAFYIAGDDGKVYVSAVSVDRMIADNFPVKNDHSVIIDSGGYIQLAKYGDIWKDRKGRNYHHRKCRY